MEVVGGQESMGWANHFWDRKKLVKIGFN